MNLETSLMEDVPATRRGAGTTIKDLLPDPRAVWALLRRNFKIFLLVFFLVVAAAIFWTSRQTPSYSATASLLVQPKGENVVDVKSVTPDTPATADVVDTRVRLIASPDLAKRVALIYGKNHPDRAPRNATELDNLATELLGLISVSRSGSTFLIDITASSHDAAQTAEVANLFAQEFVASDKDAKVSANTTADTWLRQRSEELAKEATAADGALQAYKIRHGLLSANGRSGAENQISTLDSEVAQAEADLAEKQGRLNAARQQLRSGSGGADVGAALGSGTIGGLRSREAEVSSRLAQLQATYGPEHPELKKAKSELSDVHSQIQLEINRILSNLEAEVRVASSRLSSLRSSRGQSVGVLMVNNSAQVGLDELQRRADAAKAIYETFLNRSRETNAQQGLQQADSRVAVLAQTPFEPDFPNWRLALTFALAGGFVLGVAAIGLSEYLEGGVRTKADVEHRLRVRYAGAIPTLKSTLGNMRATEPPHEYVVSHPFSSFAESFRALRAFMLLGSGAVQGSPRAIAIASPLPQEGKTTTAVCLARASAMGGVRTVLVDCDLRRRGTSELLLGPDQGGLYEYFDGSKTLDQALVTDSATGLAVLGTAAPQATAHDPLTSENVTKLVRELKQRFEVVIFDTAPVLGVADARIVASSVDRVLLVTRWRKTSLRACEAAIDMLLDVDVKLSGVALTQVDITRYASTGHTDSYSYQKKFRGYYTN